MILFQLKLISYSIGNRLSGGGLRQTKLIVDWGGRGGGGGVGYIITVCVYYAHQFHDRMPLRRLGVLSCLKTNLKPISLFCIQSNQWSIF